MSATVHLLKEQSGNKIVTKCGKELDKRVVQPGLWTVWHPDVTCGACLAPDGT